MGIKDITGKCPKCGQNFSLSDALEKQAVDDFRAELAALNDDEVQTRIEAEKESAREEGKKIATEKTLEQTKQKQKELDDTREELNAIKIKQVEKEGEIVDLKKNQETAINLKLAEQKSQLEAEKASSEAALNLQIRQLEAEKESAREEGKNIATEKTLEQTKQKQKELDDTREELNAIRLKQVEKDSEIVDLKKNRETAINLKLAEQKSQLEAEKAISEETLNLQIRQLKDDLHRATERAEQGSMQAQGEASELAIENTLREMFPRDDVTEVKKGQHGADCVLFVKNNAGRPVGKILFESKNAKNFSADWVSKLKQDAVAMGAQSAVLVTTALPADKDKAHMREGVWLCGFHEYSILTQALRQSLMDVARATASEEAREGKAQAMYDFLTSQEFAHIVEETISPIFRMHTQLETEKRVITRQWKERATLINSSISGTENLYMKIQGIAQVNLPAVQGLQTIEDLSAEIGDEDSQKNLL